MALWVSFALFSAFQGHNLVSNGSFEAGKDMWEGGGSKQALNEGGKHFLRMDIKSKPGQPYDVMISQVIDAKLPAGSDVMIRFEGRSSTGNKISAMIEDAGQPYAKYVHSDFVLGSAWKPYELTGTIAKALEGGATQLTFHCGFSAGQIDLRDIRLTSPSAIVKVDQYPRTLFNLQGLDLNRTNWVPEGTNQPKLETVASDQKGFDLATKVTVNSVGANPWDCQIGRPIAAGIQRKSIAVFSAWLRSPSKVSVSLVYELNAAPNSKAIFETVTPDGTWREYRVAVPSGFSFADNGSQVKFFFQGKGVVEVGPVSIQDLGPKADLTKIVQYLGPTPYIPTAAWRKKNDLEVAALRKGKLTVVVTGPNGKPVANALVTIHQETSNFRFGTAIPVALMMQEDDDGKHIRDVIKRMFNTVTFGNDLKWNGGGPELFPDWIYPAQQWLKKNNIQLRGHNLVWGSYQNLPAVDKSWSKEKTWDAVRTHVQDYAERMKGKLYLWDVVNEAVTETELWDKIGWDKFVEVYRIVRKADPTVKLAYNDFDMNSKNHRDTAIDRVNMIKSAGAPVDIFGDQSHLSRPVVTPTELKAIWDEINQRTGLPIEVTEFDFSSFDDKLQADYVEDFYRAAFAHPKLQAIIMWGFWEKDHWKAAQGGHMIHADWTWRPAMVAIDRLINKTWRTDEKLRTNAKGEVQIPAFFGNYSIQVGSKVRMTNHEAAGTVVRIR